MQWYLRVPRANEPLQAALDELSRTEGDTDEGVLWVAHEALDRMSVLASPREVEELAILLAGASLEQRPFFAAIEDIVETVLRDPLAAVRDYFDGLSVLEARGAVGSIVREALASTSLDIDGVDAIMHAQVTYLTEGRGPAQRASRAAALVAVHNARSHGDAAARALIVVATLDAYLAKFDEGAGKLGIPPARITTQRGTAFEPSRQNDPSGAPDATSASEDIVDVPMSTPIGYAERSRLWCGRVTFEATDTSGMLIEATVLAGAATELDAHRRFAAWAEEHAAGGELMFPTGESRSTVVRVDVIAQVGVPPLGRVIEAARYTFEVRDTAAFLDGSSRAAVVDW